MLLFKKQYQQAFQDVFEQETFRCEGNSFYRLTHDVLQVFCMRQYQGTYEFCFTIHPVALAIEDLYVQHYYISAFREKKCQWWKRQELIDTHFEEAVMITRKHVIPIFQNGIDAKTAYQALVSYEKQIYTGLPGGVIMNSWPFVLLCLQAGDFEQAEKHMEAIVEQNRSAFFSKMAQNEIYRQLDDAQVEALRKKLAGRESQLQKIRDRDTEYWNSVLEAGRKQTLSFLETMKIK